MNLQEFHEKFGPQGVKELATRLGKKPSFLTSYIYGTRSEKTRQKMPSLALAVQLHKMSGGVLTYEGMANPTILPHKKDRDLNKILPQPLE